MPNSNLAFGIDLSKWNTSTDGKKKVNFNTIAAHDPEVTFIAMRAGISWGYQDPWFNYYFTEAGRIDRVRMPYHVIFPGELASPQMDNFFRIMGEIDYSTTPLVLDLELHHNQSISTITKTTADCVRILTKRTDRIPIIYSRTTWINQFVQVSSLPPVHWWLAQYRWPLPSPAYTPEFTSPPRPLPRGVPTWLIHQTASRGKSIGAAAMRFMDYNRFNGSKNELLKFAGRKPVEPVICPVDFQPCDRASLRAQEGRGNLRNGNVRMNGER